MYVYGLLKFYKDIGHSYGVFFFDLVMLYKCNILCTFQSFYVLLQITIMHAFTVKSINMTIVMYYKFSVKFSTYSDG